MTRVAKSPILPGPHFSYQERAKRPIEYDHPSRCPQDEYGTCDIFARCLSRGITFSSSNLQVIVWEPEDLPYPPPLIVHEPIRYPREQQWLETSSIAPHNQEPASHVNTGMSFIKSRGITHDSGAETRRRGANIRFRGSSDMEFRVATAHANLIQRFPAVFSAESGSQRSRVVDGKMGANLE